MLLVIRVKLQLTICKVQAKKTNSFSKVVSYSMFPKKNQAILIDTVDGIELKAYIKAIATKTLPTNIVAASKISQNRFYCYLNSEKLVDELTREGNNEIEINGYKLYVRPYVSKAKRIIFSNAHPCIPHDEIISVLTAKGISPKSNMSFIRLGFEEEGFTQILSFRIQLFIDPSDVKKLPSVITVNYDDTLHNFYIFTDRKKCFICNKEGHIAPYCPTANTQQSMQISQITESELMKNNKHDDSENSASQIVNSHRGL